MLKQDAVNRFSYILPTNLKKAKINYFLDSFFMNKLANVYLIAINTAPLFLLENNWINDYKYTYNNLNQSADCVYTPIKINH